MVKLTVVIHNDVGILPYTELQSRLEMPKALVNDRNNFAITTIINSNNVACKLTLPSPLKIEQLHLAEVNCVEKMEPDQDLNEIYDNLLKQNLKNLRLDHLNAEEHVQKKQIMF